MTILLSYKFIDFIPFGAGEYEVWYKLTVLKTSFFGLLKKTIEVDFKLSMFCDIKSTEKRWDEFIKNKQSIILK